MAGAGIAGAGMIFVFFWGTSYARSSSSSRQQYLVGSFNTAYLSLTYIISPAANGTIVRIDLEEGSLPYV